MLAEPVEVIIGVGTHSHTHTAAVLDVRTGGVLARATVTADPDGYAALVELADQRPSIAASPSRTTPDIQGFGERIRTFSERAFQADYEAQSAPSAAALSRASVQGVPPHVLKRVGDAAMTLVAAGRREPAPAPGGHLDRGTTLRPECPGRGRCGP